MSFQIYSKKDNFGLRGPLATFPSSTSTAYALTVLNFALICAVHVNLLQEFLFLFYFAKKIQLCNFVCRQTQPTFYLQQQSHQQILF